MAVLDSEDTKWRQILDEQLGVQQRDAPRKNEMWAWFVLPLTFGLAFHGALMGIFCLFLCGLCARFIARLPGTNRVRANAARFQTGCFLALFVAALCH